LSFQALDAFGKHTEQLSHLAESRALHRNGRAGLGAASAGHACRLPGLQRLRASDIDTERALKLRAAKLSVDLAYPLVDFL
jgi:hypothetical protein